MNGSKLIIRLIDIVFILLFGFIAVSQIDSSAAIDPPKSTEAVNTTPEGTKTIVIGVTKEGTYPIESGETVLTSIDELRYYLTEQIGEAELEGLELGIRIRAHWDSPVEYGLAVARLCRDLGLPKGLDVVKLSSN